jgi:prevent-host-death family protein
MTYSIDEAISQFSKLLDLVEQGEEVVIVRHGEPVAQLVAPVAKERVLFDSMRGEISWTEGWEKPFTDQEADDFFEGKWLSA